MMEYKNTKIDWCPFIPCDWQEVRVKDIARLQSGSNLTANDIDELGDYPVYGGNGLRGYTNNYTNEGSHVLIGRQGALCGNINYAHGKFYATEHAVVVYPYDKLLNTKWLGETMRCANFNRLSASAAQPGLAVSVINNQFIPYPPKEVQERIANYLDEKTKAIDARISVLEKKSDAYTRLKASVINRAVTRGLNPNVPLKDSGIEWIGMIPEHWNRIRLKDVSYLYSGLTGKAGDDFRCDDESLTKPYVPFTNVLNNTKIDFNQFNRVVMGDNENQNRVNQNDLIFLMSSEDYESIAKSAVVEGDPGEVYLNSFCRGLHFTSQNVLASFVNYQLNSEKYRDALRFEARGFTRINIKIDKIACQFITLPPLYEQQQIIDYLDTKCSEIDNAIDNLCKQIEALKRLKRSLINEVVTGKRKV